MACPYVVCEGAPLAACLPLGRACTAPCLRCMVLRGPSLRSGCDAGFETGCTHAPAPACPLPLLAYTKPLSCVAQTTLTQGGVDLTVGSLSRTTLSDRSFGSLLWIAHSDTLFGWDLSVESFSRSSVGSLINIRTAHSDRSFGSLRRIARFTFGSLLYKKFDPPVRI